MTSRGVWLGAGAVVVVGGLITAAVLILTRGSTIIAAPTAPNPLVVDGSPYGLTGPAASGELPAACTRVFGLTAEGISVGSSSVQIGVEPAPGVKVEKVVLVITARRRIPAADYKPCVRALPPLRRGAQPPGTKVTLPRHGSTVMLPNLPGGGQLIITVSAPTAKALSRTAYTWHVSVFGQSAVDGALEPSTDNFVTLTPLR